jgi:hypothetical protein
MKLSIQACVIVIAITCTGWAQQTGTTEDKVSPPATVTGSGTANFIPMWTGTTTQGNSKIFQTGNKIGIGTTTPSVALDVSGRVRASKDYQIGQFTILAVPGGPLKDNTAVGQQALQFITTGNDNTALGSITLSGNTTGRFNTAVGALALELNSTGSSNTAVGNAALQGPSSGENNTAIGVLAMSNSNNGSENVAIGVKALMNGFDGNNNIAIGNSAALNVSGSNNIDIGNTGGSTDNGVVRIGDSSSQFSFYVAGVRSIITGKNDAVPVMIDSNGQLGTVSSSRRFKEDIQDMGDATGGLMQLRPVTFRYRKAFSDGSKPIQYGLVAEEVAEVFPDLVAHSANGQIETVKYQVLDSMLLNEVQRQQREIGELKDRLAKIEALLQSTVGTRE